jgi:type 2 lantibiotic biosynthesis protein LanM
MTLWAERMTGIVSQAATLAERLQWTKSVGVDAPHPARSERADELALRWRTAVAGGDGVRWTRRLEWDGYAEPDVQRALAGGTRPGVTPEWATLLDDVSKAARAETIGCQSKHPFSDLLHPFVIVARRRVAASRLRAGALLTADAHQSLDDALLFQLGMLARRALFQEFQQYRAAEGGGGRTVLSSALRGGSRKCYDAFVRRHLDNGLEELFARYPVLGRLLATRTLFWIQNTRALLDRFAADQAAIRATFAPDDEPVVRVESNLSDCHRGASTVAILHFASGLRLVYKPRSLGVDAHFYRLLEFLNVRHGGLPLRGLALVEGDEYGWVEFAATVPCTSPEEVDRYFERGGMLLALSFVLGASDLHSANVLACGEHPTFIDLEVIFNPLVDTGVPPERAARRHTHDTVLATALLPTRSSTGAVDFMDGGLLDRTSKQVYRRETLRHANTDMMAWGYFEFVGGGRENVPVLNGVPASTREHLGALRRGFERMYDTLLAHRSELLASGGPLRAFGNATVRVVHRPTAVYDELSSRTLHPRFLRDGAERSIEFERLRAELLVQPSRPVLWGALDAEQRELEQGDIPVFYTQPATRTLWSGGGSHADDVLLESGYEAVAARLWALGDEDRATQLDLIRISFAASDDYVVRLAERDAPAAPEPSDDDAIVDARRIGEALIALRREGPEGSWMGLVGRDSRSTRLQPLDVGLFDGTTGVALFFGALYHVTGEKQFRDVAEGSLRPTRRALRDADGVRTLAERLGIGGAYGLGGVVYAFTRLATFLGDVSLLHDAHLAASAITPRRIEEDTRLDVMFGSAGAALALLALHRVTGEEQLLRSARHCGTHLLARQLKANSEFRGHWISGFGDPETGFAHGTAGIVAALARLVQAGGGGGSALQDGMHEGLSALDACFDPSLQNWRDQVSIRGGQPNVAPWSSWCRGAAGIGFSRLLVPAVERARSATLLDAAIGTAIARNVPSKDHLCCGTCGRIDFLVTAARALGRPELLTAAREKSARVRSARAARGSYSTGYRGRGIHHAARGAAGCDSVGALMGLTLASALRAPSPRPSSLLPMLEAVRHALAPALLVPGAYARLARVMEQIPDALTTLFYLETRLADDANVDLVLRVGEEARTQLSTGTAWQGGSPAWQRVCALAAAWDGPSPFAEALHHLWLEFDVDATSRALVPGVFACFGELAPPHYSPERWHRYARAALAPLCDGAPSPALARELALCFAALPAGAYVPYVGVMLGRSDESVRLCITGLSADALAAYLAAVGWPVQRSDVMSLVEDLSAVHPAGPLHGAGMLHLDLTAQGTWRVGLEFACQRPPQLRGELREGALIERLVALGLASNEKGAALHRWPGGSATRAPDGQERVLVRRVNHVKLVLRPDRAPEAKAYLAARHVTRSAGAPVLRSSPSSHHLQGRYACS